MLTIILPGTTHRIRSLSDWPAGAPNLAVVTVSQDASGADTAAVPVLDVGGTHVTCAAVHVGRRQIRAGAQHRLRADAPAAEILHRLIDCAGQVPGPIGSVWGVAMPGPCDYSRGIALFEGVGKFDALYGFDLQRELLQRLPGAPTRVRFLNDAAAFVLGESVAGAAVGHSRVIGITLGTGVGSAFLADGQLVDQGPGVPPKAAVHLLTFAGRPLEDTVSERAIRARYARAASAEATVLTVREIAARARAGDVDAQRVLSDALTALGRVLAPLVVGFGATMLVVGGSMTRSWDLVARPLVNGIAALAPQTVDGLVVAPSRRPAQSTLLGAALHAADRVPDSA